MTSSRKNKRSGAVLRSTTEEILRPMVSFSTTSASGIDIVYVGVTSCSLLHDSEQYTRGILDIMAVNQSIGLRHIVERANAKLCVRCKCVGGLT